MGFGLVELPVEAGTGIRCVGILEELSLLPIVVGAMGQVARCLPAPAMSKRHSTTFGALDAADRRIADWSRGLFVRDRVSSTYGAGRVDATAELRASLAPLVAGCPAPALTLAIEPLNR